MLEYYARGTDLLCILSLNPELEPLPEPFRLQESVLLRVTYREYMDFIHSLPATDRIRMSGSIALTKEFARLGSPLLYNCFMRDMAFGIAKELCFAERYGRHGTKIVPTSFSTEIVPYTTIVDTASKCGNIAKQLRDIACSYGFELPNVVSSKNIDLYRLAVYLLHMSTVQGLRECNFQLNNC